MYSEFSPPLHFGQGNLSSRARSARFRSVSRRPAWGCRSPDDSRLETDRRHSLDLPVSRYLAQRWRLRYLGRGSGQTGCGLRRLALAHFRWFCWSGWGRRRMPGRRGGVSREQRTDGRRSENRPIVGMATNRLKEGLPARRILTARTDCNVYVIDTHTGAVRRIAVGLGFHGLVSVPEDQPRIHGQPPL